MTEYITREAAIDAVLGEPTDAHYPGWYAAVLMEVPAADVAPVVRCSDCKYNRSERKCIHPDSIILTPGDDDFCSYGKRKEGKRVMSYDLRIAVKVRGCDRFAVIATPEYDQPTYNLGEMFRACTGWDYHQGEYYNCAEVIGKIEQGIHELSVNRQKYKPMEPSNGWGSIASAKLALESLRDCIYEQAEDIPIECLWVAW